MTKLSKLTSDDISFMELTRAYDSGDQPSVTFRIKNPLKVAKFIDESESLGLIWSKTLRDPLGRDTLRLSYAYSEDRTKITFARVVTPSTIAVASNLTLADGVLTCVINAELGDFADIYSGLTGLPYTRYEPAPISKKILDEHYENVDPAYDASFSM